MQIKNKYLETQKKQIDKYANIEQIYRNIDEIDRQICKYRIDIQKHR